MLYNRQIGKTMKKGILICILSAHYKLAIAAFPYFGF